MVVPGQIGLGQLRMELPWKKQKVRLWLELPGTGEWKGRAEGGWHALAVLGKTKRCHQHWSSGDCGRHNHYRDTPPRTPRRREWGAHNRKLASLQGVSLVEEPGRVVRKQPMVGTLCWRIKWLEASQCSRSKELSFGRLTLRVTCLWPPHVEGTRASKARGRPR